MIDLEHKVETPVWHLLLMMYVSTGQCKTQPGVRTEMQTEAG